MSWHEQFQRKMKTQPQHQKAYAGPTEVNGISGIPDEATQSERFRLVVDVDRVCERETKAGEPCYFLSCRDAEDEHFCIVVWESQWSRFQDRLKEGSQLSLDMRVPKEGFSAFTLA